MVISAVIPVYGRIDYLDACLASLEADDVELIIVDDGNAPSEATVIRELANKHGAQYLRLEKNVGAAAARNAGVRIASGSLLFFADADIKLEPGALSVLKNALSDTPAAAFAYGDFVYGAIRMNGQTFSVETLKKQNYISTMSLVRRESFSGFDERLRRFQDWDLWLSIAESGKKGVYVPQLIFTAHPGGTMSNWIPSFIVHHAQWFSWIPRVRAYSEAKKIISVKHSLS